MNLCIIENWPPPPTSLGAGNVYLLKTSALTMEGAWINSSLFFTYNASRKLTSTLSTKNEN